MRIDTSVNPQNGFLQFCRIIVVPPHPREIVSLVPSFRFIGQHDAVRKLRLWTSREFSSIQQKCNWAYLYHQRISNTEHLATNKTQQHCGFSFENQGFATCSSQNDCHQDIEINALERTYTNYERGTKEASCNCPVRGQPLCPVDTEQEDRGLGNCLQGFLQLSQTSVIAFSHTSWSSM